MYLMQTLEPSTLTSMCISFEEDRKEFDPHQYGSTGEDVSSKLKDLGDTKPGLRVQLQALGIRAMQAVIRDKASLGARFGGTTVLNLIFALIFFQIAKVDDDYDSMSHFGALSNIGISGMFGNAQPTLLLFPFERPLFVREYAKGTYSGGAYFWSKLFVELPLTFATAVITLLVAYWIEGLHGNFILHVLILWLLGLAASSTALVAGCVAASAKQAVEMAPALFVPQILFAGFFVKMEQIPVFLRWAQYLCSLKFGINLFLINEFTTDCPDDNSADFRADKRCADGKLILDRNDVDQDLWWLYVLILVGIFLLFRMLAMVLLVRRARGFDLA